MADIIRQFTQTGIDEFKKYILNSRQGTGLEPIPYHLLWDNKFSVEFSYLIEIERNQFDTGYESAQYFAELFRDVDYNEIGYKSGLWSWLSLYYLEELLEKRRDPTAPIYLPRNYILFNDIDPGYHKLVAPCQFYRTHREESRLLLSWPVGNTQKLADLVMRNYTIARSVEMVKVVNLLYIDDTGKIKVNASGNIIETRKQGSFTRLSQVCEQLSQTYDIYNMERDKIIALLPDEFDSWLPDSYQKLPPPG